MMLVPAQIVVALALAVMAGVVMLVILMVDEIALPWLHVFDGNTLIGPDVDPMVTTILVVPLPLVMVEPDGTVHE